MSIAPGDVRRAVEQWQGEAANEGIKVILFFLWKPSARRVSISGRGTADFAAGRVSFVLAVC
jgi:hypothetical protein